MDTTLIVLAAGMGSRYGGIKQLDPVGMSGETILEFSVHDAFAAGFSRVVFVIRRDIEKDFRDVVLAHLKDTYSVSLAYQELGDLPGPDQAATMATRLSSALPEPLSEEKPPTMSAEVAALVSGRVKPWGTAHALWSARNAASGSVAVINADDFYGPSSFRLMHDFLIRAEGRPGTYAMVGYELGKTLSPNGTVARGICSEDGRGRLVSIREHTKLGPEETMVRSEQEDGSMVRFAPDTRVSMNFFGFSSDIFERCGDYLRNFIQNLGTAGEERAKKEAYIPSVVNDLVQRGKATVEVLRTSETWFGVTYRDDRPLVAANIRALVERGIYPSNLRKQG